MNRFRGAEPRSAPLQVERQPFPVWFRLHASLLASPSVSSSGLSWLSYSPSACFPLIAEADAPAPARRRAGDSPREQRLNEPDLPAPDPRWWIRTTSSNTASSEEQVCPRRPDSLESGQDNLHWVERRDWVSCVFMPPSTPGLISFGDGSYWTVPKQHLGELYFDEPPSCWASMSPCTQRYERAPERDWLGRDRSLVGSQVRGGAPHLDDVSATFRGDDEPPAFRPARWTLAQARTVFQSVRFAPASGVCPAVSVALLYRHGPLPHRKRSAFMGSAEGTPATEARDDPTREANRVTARIVERARERLVALGWDPADAFPARLVRELLPKHGTRRMCPEAIYRAIARGQLEATRIGREWFTTIEGFAAWVSRRTHGVGQAVDLAQEPAAENVHAAVRRRLVGRRKRPT